MINGSWPKKQWIMRLPRMTYIDTHGQCKVRREGGGTGLVVRYDPKLDTG